MSSQSRKLFILPTLLIAISRFGYTQKVSKAMACQKVAVVLSLPAFYSLCKAYKEKILVLLLLVHKRHITAGSDFRLCC